MILKNQLLQKYFLLAIATIVGFIVLGFYSHFWVTRLLSTPRSMIEEPLPPLFFARLVDRLNSQDKLAAIQELYRLQDDNRGPKLHLYSYDGRLLYPSDGVLKQIPRQVLEPLVNDYAYVSLQNEKLPGASSNSEFDRGSKGPSIFPGFGPPPGGPPPGPFMNRTTVIRLAGSPAYFVTIAFGPPKIPMPPPKGMPNPILAPIFLIISLVLGIGMTMFMVYNSVAKQVRQADQVISQLQAGNLKARFPVTRQDEFGKAMLRFNKMAEEIEHLVEHLRSAESARSNLLQQLAHDLRTPIAALKSMLQTLNESGPEKSKELQKEFLDLSLKETLYFESLVEDLLFLAQVSEPRYRLGREKVDVHQLLEEVLDDAEFMMVKNSQSKTIERNFNSSLQFIDGDPHLLTRLFRNAIDNALSFSKTRVQISTVDFEGQLQIRIVDDGPGFSVESLAAYGKKRLSRKLVQDSGARVSNGLGSVIIKSIAELHRGQIRVSNLSQEASSGFGAMVEIDLPQIMKPKDS